MAKENDGAPGIDGVTFEAIEQSGVEGFLEQIRNELVSNTYRPMQARKKEIPKDGGKKVRVLSIPAIRDRVVQGALKLILEPIFEADFQSGSYGYRPKRTLAPAAIPFLVCGLGLIGIGVFTTPTLAFTALVLAVAGPLSGLPAFWETTIPTIPTIPLILLGCY
jgi:hypothetical protein